MDKFSSNTVKQFQDCTDELSFWAPDDKYTRYSINEMNVQLEHNDPKRPRDSAKMMSY